MMHWVVGGRRLLELEIDGSDLERAATSKGPDADGLAVLADALPVV